MKALLLTVFLFFSISGFGDNAASSYEVALKKLVEGNARFTTNQSFDSHEFLQKLQSTQSGQKPFAVIVSCSDSRVPTEIIFDQGVGDLFIVRVAGNIVGPIELDSIEFATSNFQVPLIFVLGHQNCGAVSAVLNNSSVMKELDNIVPYIEPAVEASKKFPKKFSEDPLEDAIKTNVVFVIDLLKNSTVIAPLLQKKQVEIVGGYFRLDNGKVELLEIVN